MLSDLRGAEAVMRFRGALAARLGLAFEEDRLHQLSEVLTSRVASRGGTAADYLDQLEREGPPEELSSLARRLTIGETYFFRHGQQFEALRWLLATAPRRSTPPRVLSAGCASGEEAYSLAMLLRELWPDREATVIGADLNPAGLERAQAGRYSAWSLRETPPLLLASWFRRDGREYVIDESIRRRVRFVATNLAAPDPELLGAGAFDVVFCRNVLMYFTPDQFRATVARLSQALMPQGYLFLGTAETLRGVSEDFHLRHTHGAFYYQRKALHELGSASRSNGLPPPAVAPPLVAAAGPAWAEAIAGATERVALLGACPDQKMQDAEPKAQRRRPSALKPERGARGRPNPDLTAVLELLRLERFAEALERLRAHPAASGSEPEVLLLEAVLLSSSGRFVDAERTCWRLLEIDGLNAGAHYVLGLCNAGAGRVERAVHHDQVAVYLDPGFAMPRLHLGLMLRREGHMSRARGELLRARSLLEREDGARLALFGGGFSRGALLALCDAEIEQAGSG